MESVRMLLQISMIEYTNLMLQLDLKLFYFALSDFFFQAMRNPDSRASMMIVEDVFSFSNSSGV